ncbi:MAG: hypothetical protein WED11_10280 [Natronospirillum sp.]
MSVAAFLVAFRGAQCVQGRKNLTTDVATGLFMMALLVGLVVVGVFVVTGANLTQTSHMSAGLFVESVLATLFFPAGILLLKKKHDFS